MIKASAPGLPTWPPLWFDQRRKVAMVTARYANWRSYQWAITTTKGCIFFVCTVLAIAVFLYTPIPHFLYRLIAVMIVGGIVFPILGVLIRENLRDALARQLFPTRTVVRFRPEAIIIRSNLYAQAVTIPRRWRGRPVTIRFLIDQDQKAALAAERSPRGDWKYPRQHLQTAVIVFAVISCDRPTSSDSVARRLVPICQASSEQSVRLTTVFTEAANLTADRGRRHQQQGRDIDRN